MPVTNYHTVNGEMIGETTAGVRTDYLTDALGSVTAIVDQSQTVVNTYRFKPYGELLNKTGAAADPKFLWVGSWGYRTLELTVAFLYVRLRHYMKSTSRWTSVDNFWPREPKYAYASSNPATFIDIWGRQDNSSGVIPGKIGPAIIPPDIASEILPGLIRPGVPPSDTCSEPHCCQASHLRFQAWMTHCPSGWSNCPSESDLDGICSQVSWGISECAQLYEILIEIADICVKQCAGSSGGGYGLYDPWDAASDCCTDMTQKKSYGCGVKCCNKYLSTIPPRSGDKIRACSAKCLMLHEGLHIKECNKLAPNPDSTPPYNECCAYAGQAKCLLDILTKNCTLPIPEEYKACISGSQKFNCSSRY